MPSVLFVCLHRPNRSPSQRFRFEQYISFLNDNGFDCKFSYLVSEVDDKVFYKPGHYFAKAGLLFKSSILRLKETLKRPAYDIVFVQRECYMLGTAFFEKKFAKNSKLIFDYDDSIWMQLVSEGNKKLSFLKNSNKTNTILSVAHMVFAGNQYLADYAKKYNHSRIEIVPTTIDTDEYKPSVERKINLKICIGWSGSFTTIPHFEYMLEAYKIIYQRFANRIYFKVIGDGEYKQPLLNIKGLPWQKDTEIQELHEINIGIMPLPDDEWAKGKCGLKGLQYMALGIPTIMSPVGVNTEIIQDGENGMLASTVEQWVEKLTQLIESAELRNRLGSNGRKTVVEKYSLNANKYKYLQLFSELIASKK